MSRLSNNIFRSAVSLIEESDSYGVGWCKRIEDYTPIDIAKAYLEVWDKSNELYQTCRSNAGKIRNYDRVVADNVELRQKLYKDNKEYIQEEVEKRFRRTNSNIVNEIESKLASKYKEQISNKDNKILELESEIKSLKENIEEWKSKFTVQANANAILIETLSKK